MDLAALATSINAQPLRQAACGHWERHPQAADLPCTQCQNALEQALEDAEEREIEQTLRALAQP